jgi:hypothetical protein
MSFFVPPGPTIPASSKFSDVQTSIMATDVTSMPKSIATIPYGNFSSITNIDQAQGIIEITFQDEIAPNTKSSGTLTLQMTDAGIPLSSTSLVFLSMIKTSGTSGNPLPTISQILPMSEGIQNGQIYIYITNVNPTETIGEEDTASMAYYIIN